MLSICDTEVKDGKIVVVDQRDWNVPRFDKVDIAILCEDTRGCGGCDDDCDKCVITRITENK